MNKQSIREIFDDISLSLITFLDNHVGITDIEFIERQGRLSLSLRRGLNLNQQMGRRECSILSS